MRKLLNANFARLRRDKMFYIAAILVLGCSVVMIFNAGRVAESLRSSGYDKPLEYFYYELAPYLGLIDGMFISLFLGTEHSDGTVRNKIVAGHTRMKIYMANYLTCLGACLTFAGLWLLGGLPGLRLISPFAFGLSGYIGYLLVIVAITAAFTAVFTWIATACHNKAITVVLSLAVWIGMILIGSGLIDRLEIPELSGGLAYINGEFVMQEPTPNPMYLRGTARAVCEFFRDCIPTGPAIQMTDGSIETPVRQTVLGLEFALAATALGLISFRKKDLR